MPIGMQDKDDVVVKGRNGVSGADVEINSVDDDGKERLCVDAKLTNSEGGNEVSFSPNDYLIDPFGRLRIVEPLCIFAHKFRTGPDLSISRWDTSVTGGATKAQDDDNTSLALHTTTAINDEYEVSTRQYLHYVPGYGFLVLMTGNFHGVETGVEKRLGIYDDEDGMFWDNDGTDVGVCLRSSTSGSPVDERVAQSSWNLDKMDGTGPSGITVDWTKQQIFILDYQWLGAGTVRFGLDIGGKAYFVHAFYKSNVIENPYSTSGDLPIRFGIKNITAQGAARKMHITCISVIREGEEGTSASHNITISSMTNEIALTSSPKHIASVRMDNTSNRFSISPETFEVIMTSGTKFLFYQILHNPTFTGTPTWTSTGLISEYAVGTDAVYASGGTVLLEGHINVGGSTTVSEFEDILGSFSLGRSISGTSDILTLVAETSGGTAKIVFNGQFTENV